MICSYCNGLGARDGMICPFCGDTGEFEDEEQEENDDI